MTHALPQDPSEFSDPIDAMVARAERQASRPVDYWDIPASMGEQRHVQFRQNGQVLEVETVGLILLTADEQKMALARAGSQPVTLGYEMTKQALASVRYVGDAHDRQLSVADGSVDAFWQVCHPAVRDLLVAAYGIMHQPSDQAAADFLVSRRRTPRAPAKPATGTP